MNELTVALLNALPTPVAVVTGAGEISYRNRAFEETFGDQAAAWIKAGARTVGGERGWVQSFFGTAEQTRTEVDFHGRVYHVERLEADIGEDLLPLSFDDVTAQRNMEQAKSDFTSMIVHDLRGPLSGIQGTLDFVLNDGSSKIETMHADLLVEAMRESERLMNLINEILDFSKIESGNFAVESEPVRLAGVLRRSVRSLLSVANRENIHLLSAHAGELPQIQGSEEKLTQAIINLVSNALKFTPKQGVIAVGAQVARGDEGPEALVITVTDTGIGIKPAEQKLIFEKYKQSRNKSLRGGRGTGLGLYIVRQVVEAHGGTVEIASVEGIGTSMILSIPLKRAVA
jgi:signal transduction histidine kinase